MPHRILVQKMTSDNSFVVPERISSTEASTKYHSLRTYFQVMVWKGNGQDRTPTQWGWNLGESKDLYPIRFDMSPVPQSLLHVIRCKCKMCCDTFRCTCKAKGWFCSAACGRGQTSRCANVLSCADVESEDEAENTVNID